MRSRRKKRPEDAANFLGHQWYRNRQLYPESVLMERCARCDLYRIRIASDRAEVSDDDREWKYWLRDESIEDEQSCDEIIMRRALK